MKKKPGARGVSKEKKLRIRKRKASLMLPHTPEPEPLLDAITIARIAADESENVTAPLPGHALHNVKTIAHAIQRALDAIPNSRLELARVRNAANALCFQIRKEGGHGMKIHKLTTVLEKEIA